MPQQLGAHNSRIAHVRELLTKKGREAEGAFLLEGPTLLSEADRSSASLRELYVTQKAFDSHALLHKIEAGGVPVYIVNDATAAKLSEVETPTGIVAVCASRTVPPAQFFAQDGPVLLLAGINDPGNAGTLVRSADAFGVRRVLFGSGSVEPFNPKVVRASMGSLFHIDIAVGTPAEVTAAAGGWDFFGLTARGEPLGDLRLGPRSVLVVGHERHGLGAWEPLCGRSVGIPMAGAAESLNAAVAGSIALYESTRPPA